MSRLEEAKKLFEYAKSSSVRQKWRVNYNKCKQYFEGDQWLDEELNNAMDDIKATRYTFNQIDRLVNLFTSLQIRSGKRCSFALKSDVPGADKIVTDLKEMCYKINADSDYTYHSSVKFTNMLIGGIGVSSYEYVRDVDEKVVYKNIDPEEIFLDPDDCTLKLTNSSFIARSHFVPIHKLEAMYPRYKKYFRDLVGKEISSTCNNSVADDILAGNWSRGRSVRITEVEYKKNVPCYKIVVSSHPRETFIGGNTRSFLLFDTFEDEEDLFDMLNDNFGKLHITIEKVFASRIFKTVFSGDNLLYHGPLETQVPNQSTFSYVPVILRRDTEGVPYGVVNMFFSLQDSRNYLWSTIIHYMDSKTVVVNIEKGQLSNINQAELVRKEITVKKGVIVTSSGKDYQIIDHGKDVADRIKLLDANSREFEKLSGLFDTELSGTEDKNMSGVAINMRSINTMNAQNHILLAYDSMLVLEGTNLLNVIKGIDDLTIRFSYKIDGKNKVGLVSFEHKTLGYDVYVDTNSNFLSSSEEDRIRFSEVLSSPNAGTLLSSEIFLKSLGFSGNKSNELVKEYERLQGGKDTKESDNDAQNVPTEDTYQ